MWRAFPASIKTDSHDSRDMSGADLGGRRARTGAPAVLLGLAGAVRLGLGYVVPWSAVLSRRTRPEVSTADGTWCIWVVASRSVAVAGICLGRADEPPSGWSGPVRR